MGRYCSPGPAAQTAHVSIEGHEADPVLHPEADRGLVLEILLEDLGVQGPLQLPLLVLPEHLEPVPAPGEVLGHDDAVHLLVFKLGVHLVLVTDLAPDLRAAPHQYLGHSAATGPGQVIQQLEAGDLIKEQMWFSLF